MNSRDDKLTHKNVDEQIEQCLSQSQDFQTPAMVSLFSTVQDLQRIYEEDRRLEHVWARINSRVSALAAVRILRETEELYSVMLAQTALQGTRRVKKRLRWFPLGCLIVGIVLVAAIILIAFFTWPMWSHALHGLHM